MFEPRRRCARATPFTLAIERDTDAPTPCPASTKRAPDLKCQQISCQIRVRSDASLEDFVALVAQVTAHRDSEVDVVD